MVDEPNPSLSPDAVVGTEIAGFRIEHMLGRSGAGDVYLAYDLRLGRKVALKLLPPRLAEDSALRERFVRQSQVLASLEHPNVVPVYAAGEEAGHVYMVMRYVPEGTLRVRLRTGRLEPDTAVSIVAQVAAALDAAHERHFVHRDVKPENILVDSSGTAYLVDFFVPTVSAGPGRVFGTPPYMAPEQCRGHEVDGRSDLYALACVFFECLTASAPFGDEGMTTITAHVHEPVPRLSDRRPDLPAALDSVFDKALAKSPPDRYESGAAMVEAVADALGSRGRRVDSGTVTFLFTDIEGSTGLLRRLRERYAQLIAQHQRLLRAAFAQHGGREVDTQGESFFAVFPTATEAVVAAVAAQKAIAAHAWPDGIDLRVRIGLHTGQAALTGERYFGLAVHRAARICAVGAGGQTVLSQTTHALLEDEEEDLPGIRLRDLGLHELKDFERPVRLYEAVAG